MAENNLDSRRVRLQPVAGDGRPGEPRLGPNLAALVGPGSATAPDPCAADEPGPTPPGEDWGAIPDEAGFEHLDEPAQLTGRRPGPADHLPPVAPGPSVQSLMTPRTRYDEERPADVVPIPKRPAGDPRGESGPVVALPETPVAEDFGGPSEDDRDPHGAAPLLADQHEGRDDSGPRAMHAPHSSGPRTINLPRPRRSVALIAAATIVGILTVAGVSLIRATGAADQAAAPPALAPVVGNDVIMDTWRGMDLPVSAVAGPFVTGETHVSGFARTELGAAVAAAHLSVRLDPAAGPPTFEAVLEDQVVGDADRMAAAVRNQYRAEATREQQAAGQPLPVTPGQLVGWRTDGDLSAGAVTVHLAVQAPAGGRSDFAVPLRWISGDWAVDAAESGPFFPVTALSGEYRAFATGEVL